MKTEMRALILTYVAIGMIVSYMSGYMLIRHRLQDTDIKLMLEKGKVKEARARVQELRARAADRDLIERDLRSCYASVGGYVEALEDIKWQMHVVMSTCPGRDRPPRTPRP